MQIVDRDLGEAWERQLGWKRSGWQSDSKILGSGGDTVTGESLFKTVGNITGK